MSAKARIATLAVASAFAGFALSSAACGGSGAAAGPAKSGNGTGSEKSDHEQSEQGTGGEEEAAPRAAPCADGSCLECGTGLCPKGFYCDEKAPGGPACGWLPECASSATCSCVKQALGSGCTCSEKAGGPSVSCQ